MVVYYLTLEQEEKLSKLVGICDFEYSPFGFGYNILARSPQTKENIILGRVENGKLEIFPNNTLPKNIRDGFRNRMISILRLCDLEAKEGS